MPERKCHASLSFLAGFSTPTFVAGGDGKQGCRDPKTMLGYGIRFYRDGDKFAGQNERSFPVVLQYIDDKSYVVWPKSQAQREAVLPLPAGTTYSYK